MIKPVQKISELLKGRNHTPDLLKGAAVIFMIQVHIVELLWNPELFSGGWGKVFLFLGGPPAAPVFMLMMGYYLAQSRKSTVQLIRRGLLVFAGGILLNILLNFSLLVLIFSGSEDYNPFHYILGADILHLAGLSIIVIALLRTIKKNTISVFIAAFVAFSAIIYFLPFNYLAENEFIRYVLAFIFTREYWSYFPLLPWVLYPLAGYIAALIFSTIKVPEIIKYLSAVMFLPFLYFTLPYVEADITSLTAYYHHDVFLLIWILLFCEGYAAVVYISSNYLAKNSAALWLRWIGKNVTAAYVIQWIIIGNTGTFFYRSWGYEISVVFFVIVLAAVTAGIYIWEWVKIRRLK